MFDLSFTTSAPPPAHRGAAPVLPARGRAWTLWEGTTARLVLTGEFDRADQAFAMAVAADALSAHPERLVIDLGRVTFVDLGFTRALLQLGRDVSRAGTAVSLVRPPRCFLVVLTVLGTEHAVDVEAAGGPAIVLDR